MILAQIDTAQHLVDHAAQQSDRWLFLALLVLVLFGGILIIKYLVNTLDAQRKTYGDFISTAFKEHVTLTAQILVVMQDSNELMKQTRELLVVINNKFKHGD